MHIHGHPRERRNGPDGVLSFAEHHCAHGAQTGVRTQRPAVARAAWWWRRTRAPVRPPCAVKAPWAPCATGTAREGRPSAPPPPPRSCWAQRGWAARDLCQRTLPAHTAGLDGHLLGGHRRRARAALAHRAAASEELLHGPVRYDEEERSVAGDGHGGHIALEAVNDADQLRTGEARLSSVCAAAEAPEQPFLTSPVATVHCVTTVLPPSSLLQANSRRASGDTATALVSRHLLGERE
jgi:hypothetical protein